MTIDIPTPADVKQNKAIKRLYWLLGIVIFLAICLFALVLSGPSQSPLVTQPFWEGDETEEAPAPDENTSTGCTHDNGTYTADVAIEFDDVWKVCTDDGEGNFNWKPIDPVVTEPAAPVEEEAPAAEIDDSVIWLAGGRLDWNNNPHEVIAVANSTIFTDGTPMQMLWSQVGNESLANFNEGYEVCNDGGCSQYFIVQEDGEWMAYIINREDKKVSFWEVSWMKYIPADHYITVCVDDAGSPGDMADVDGDDTMDKWVGACAGEKMRIDSRMPLDDLMASQIFTPWAEELMTAMQEFDGNIDNNLLEVVTIFRQE